MTGQRHFESVTEEVFLNLSVARIVPYLVIGGLSVEYRSSSGLRDGCKNRDGKKRTKTVIHAAEKNKGTNNILNNKGLSRR